MLKWEIELMYDDYCYECEIKGIEPKDIETWWEDYEIN